MSVRCERIWIRGKEGGLADMQTTQISIPFRVGLSHEVHVEDCCLRGASHAFDTVEQDLELGESTKQESFRTSCAPPNAQW